MSLSYREIITRLRGRSLDYYLQSPYAIAFSLSKRQLLPLVNLLKAQKAPTLEQVKPLLLCDLSVEIKSMAENFSQGEAITNEDAAQRATQAAEDILKSDEANSTSSASPNIVNRNRFPDVDFLPADEIRPVGDTGGTTLVLVGKEQGSNAPVVALSYTNDPASEDLFAVPLYELLNHSQDPINLPGLK